MSVDPLLVSAVITTLTWVGIAVLAVFAIFIAYVIICLVRDEVTIRRSRRKAKVQELLDRAIIAEAYLVVEREYTAYLREESRRRDHE